MKKILVVGAGRSATSLIDYLLKESIVNDWKLIIADSNLKLAEGKVNNHPNAKAVFLDVYQEEARELLVEQVDLVISMLPAMFHPILCVSCIKFRKSMLTASYVSAEMQAMDREAKKAGVLFLDECGLDPGLDHMTAVRAIDHIKRRGGELTLLKSFTGGLIAPESDDNPWGYKFTWNPRNVVLAGQGGTAKFILNGSYKYIPYHKLFDRYEPIHINGYGDFEGYANRDSLRYKTLYGIENIPTMLRGTLRRPGFCDAWSVFVQLGMTDDSYCLDRLEQMTYREYVGSFLGQKDNEDIENSLCEYLNIERGSSVFQKLQWLEIFSEKKINLKDVSPAAVLQKILEEKWVLEEKDKDMVVMQHILGYSLEGKKFQASTSIVCKGDDARHTAIAKTVGWPLAIAAKLVLQNKIRDKGVVLPIKPHIYNAILGELENLGIKFLEEEIQLA